MRPTFNLLEVVVAEDKCGEGVLCLFTEHWDDCQLVEPEMQPSDLVQVLEEKEEEEEEKEEEDEEEEEMRRYATTSGGSG